MKNGRSAVCTLTWSWWRHQMETFSPLLALCVGNSPVPVNSPHQGQFSLICARINDWVNNREAGELRRYRGHYDVIVMEPWATLHWILETAFDYTFETDARMTLTFLIFLRSRDRFLSNYDFDRGHSLVKASCRVYQPEVATLVWTRENMMTSSNGDIFRVTGHLRGEFTGPRWIPRTKASDAELWCFLWSAPE